MNVKRTLIHLAMVFVFVAWLLANMVVSSVPASGQSASPIMTPGCLPGPGGQPWACRPTLEPTPFDGSGLNTRMVYLPLVGKQSTEQTGE